MNKINKITDKGKAGMFTALFTAVICVSGFISFPLPFSPVPVVLQDMMCFLSGILLGPVWGFLSTLLYFVLGLIGLPVFSGGRGGLTAFLTSPTSGFILGYIAGTFAAALIMLTSVKTKKYILTALTAAVVAEIIIFLLGIIWFMKSTGFGMGDTLAKAVIPFIPGTIVKILIVIPLVKWVYPQILNRMYIVKDE